MTPHPRQLLLDGRTLEEADAPPPKPAPLRGNARWAADVDGVRTLDDLAAVWWPVSGDWGPWREFDRRRKAGFRLEDLCRSGHVLPPLDGWRHDSVPQPATPKTVAAVLAPVDGRACVVDLAEAWWGRSDVEALRSAWTRLRWLRARRLIARLPVAYYPERWGGYVPRREGGVKVFLA